MKNAYIADGARQISHNVFLVESQQAVWDAVLYFRKQLGPAHSRVEKQEGYQFTMAHVPAFDTVEYPRVIGLTIAHDMSQIEVAFSFGLLDTIDLTAAFTLNGFS